MISDMNKNLLTESEKIILTTISSLSSPHGKRARALLALQDGASQVKAGSIADLSRDQVKYWLAKFRVSRMGIFPDSLTSVAALPEEPPSLDNIGETNDIPQAEITMKTKSKKGKKGKGKNSKKEKKQKEKNKKGKKKKDLKKKDKKKKDNKKKGKKKQKNKGKKKGK